MPLSRDLVVSKFSSPFVIGISGVATSGKDTFFTILQQYLDLYGIKVQRFALADKLKDELDPFLKSHVGISAWTSNPEEKKTIRPMLVAYGKVKRIQSNGKHWTRQIEPDLKKALAQGIIPVVTDIRYAEYDGDEVHWLRQFGGKLVYVSRYVEELGTVRFIAPPNEDEARNDIHLRNAATKVIQWSTVGTPNLENLSSHVESFISSL